MTRLVIAILVLVCAYLVYEFGRIQANYNIVDAGHERDAYEARIVSLSEEIESLSLIHI